MPLPKRRHSHARQAKRRANWKLETPNLQECPNCRRAGTTTYKLPHHACPVCGTYNGRQVVAVKEKTPKAS